MSNKGYEELSVFQQIMQGLEDGIAHSRGQLSLRTTTLPAPPPPASARRVAALRRKLGMSQSVFAATLNVSPKLVQSWEQGLRRPLRGDLRLIQILEKDPGIVRALFGYRSRTAGSDGKTVNRRRRRQSPTLA